MVMQYGRFSLMLLLPCKMMLEFVLLAAPNILPCLILPPCLPAGFLVGNVCCLHFCSHPAVSFFVAVAHALVGPQASLRLVFNAVAHHPEARNTTATLRLDQACASALQPQVLFIRDALYSWCSLFLVLSTLGALHSRCSFILVAVCS